MSNDCFEMNNCNDCEDKKPCGCEKTYNILCGIYNGDFLETLNISKGENLQDIIVKINEKLNEIISTEISCDFSLNNTGDGVELYNSITQETGNIKSLIESELIKIKDNSTTVDFSIDENALENLFDEFLEENGGVLCSILNNCDDVDTYTVTGYFEQGTEVELTTLSGTTIKTPISSVEVNTPAEDTILFFTITGVPNGNYIVTNVLTEIDGVGGATYADFNITIINEDKHIDYEESGF